MPVLAVREALVNAVCHRDYSKRNASLMLAIFDDRLELWNYGTLPKEIKFADLKREHISLPHNKNIAKVFYDRKFFERWGTGTNRIFRLCKEAQLPDPTFEENSGGILLTFTFKEPIGATTLKNKRAVPELLSRQQAILALIKQHTRLSSKQILNLMENPPAERTVRNDLNQLEQYGFIVKKGSARSTIWVFKDTPSE